MLHISKNKPKSASSLFEFLQHFFAFDFISEIRVGFSQRRRRDIFVETQTKNSPRPGRARVPRAGLGVAPKPLSCIKPCTPQFSAGRRKPHAGRVCSPFLILQLQDASPAGFQNPPFGQVLLQTAVNKSIGLLRRLFLGAKNYCRSVREPFPGAKNCPARRA